MNRYVEPATLDRFAREAERRGFAYVASAQLVRVPQPAAEVFVRSILRPGDARGADTLLKERLEEAQTAAERHGGAPRTTSELAARAAKTLLPAESLVRR